MQVELEQLLLENAVEEARVRALRDARNARIANLHVKYAGDTYRYMKYAAYPALLQIRCKYATKYAANSKYVILYIITGVIYIRYMYIHERERERLFIPIL